MPATTSIYALQPARVLIALVRRLLYLGVAEMRVLGTIVLLLTVGTCKAFRAQAWGIVAAVAALNILLVSVLGGAELERYLLPVLPLFYIAVSVGLTEIKRPVAITATAVMILALVLCIGWNPPYPFPFENNFAMVDFLHLQQAASAYADRSLRRPQNRHRLALHWRVAQSRHGFRYAQDQNRRNA